MQGKLAAFGAGCVLIAGCAGSSGSGGSAALPKDAVTAGPVVSFCTPGYMTTQGQFTTQRMNELAYQLTIRNKSASAVLVRYMTVRFLIPGQVPWSAGDSVNYNMIFDSKGPATGHIAPGATVSWVFNSVGSGIPPGIAHCALETWSSSPTGQQYDSHPWPPR
jgi:hypothetical protein